MIRNRFSVLRMGTRWVRCLATHYKFLHEIDRVYVQGP